MLNKELVRVKLPRGGGIEPGLIDPTRDTLVEAAEQIVAQVEAAAEEKWTRGELDEALTDAIGDRRDQKLVRGLAKLMLDRCDFETDCALPPTDLREAVFRAARAAGGVALQRGPLGRPTAADVLAEVAPALKVPTEGISDALYADLPDEQRLVHADLRSPEWLLNRYNISLVQSVLLHATQVRIVLEDAIVPRIRQLLRYAKFYELVHRAERQDKALVLTLDGPGSLFHQSTRYGKQLASFFPALPLQDGPWSLTADIRWQRSHRTLSLDHTAGLVSHYRDTGAYETRTHEWFVERFRSHNDDSWTLDRRVHPVDLGGRAVVLPDYRLRSGGRTAYLEILGYWKRDYLERRIEGLRRHGPGNLILAVSKKLGDVDQLDEIGAEVVLFSKIVPVKDVLAAAERVAL